MGACLLPVLCVSGCPGEGLGGINHHPPPRHACQARRPRGLATAWREGHMQRHRTSASTPRGGNAMLHVVCCACRHRPRALRVSVRARHGNAVGNKRRLQVSGGGPDGAASDGAEVCQVGAVAFFTHPGGSSAGRRGGVAAARSRTARESCRCCCGGRRRARLSGVGLPPFSTRFCAYNS